MLYLLRVKHLNQRTPVTARGSPTMNPQTPADFVRSLESALQPRRVLFSRAALIAFVESTWSWIEDDPDVEYWCERFLDGMDRLAPA
jgi:hypothetical protein